MHIKKSEIDILWQIIDGLIIIGSLILAAQLYNNAWSDKYSIAAVLGVMFFYIAAKFNNIYTDSRHSGMMQLITPVVATWFGAITGLLIVGYLAKVTANYSRVTLSLWFIITPALLILFRWALRKSLKAMHKHWDNSRTAIIVGTGKCGRHLANNIEHMPISELRLLGFINENEYEANTQVLGGLDELYLMVSTSQVEVVFIAMPINRQKLISEVLARLADSTVSIFIVPDFDTYGIAHTRWINFGDVPAMSVIDTPIIGINVLAKRVEDLIVSVTGIIIVAPLMALIAVAIKLDSKGPVFYVQKRHGFNGKIIPVIKFRSMKVVGQASEFKQVAMDDDRVTRVGRFIRKTSIDELPQLFNVLAGQMSIVGPRPHAIAHNEQFRGAIQGFMLRHKIKPGLTGLAQINGCRGEIKTKEMMEDRLHYDMEYINNWSTWLDLLIILKTPVAVIRCKNVY